MHLKSNIVEVKAPEGVLVGSYSFYTHAKGVQLKSRIAYSSRSDTTDNSFTRFSEDNGATWTQPIREPGPVSTAAGVLRRSCFPGVCHTTLDAIVTIVLQGVLPNDRPLEGQKSWTLRYAVSKDGGRTNFVDEPIIQHGDEFAECHPISDVWIGKNAAMVGDKTCVPIWRSDGTLLVPIQISPLDNAGRLYNPGGGYTYHYAAVLLGKPTNDYKFQWHISQPIHLDPSLSTRGCLEPTLAQLADERILVVMRGSNDKQPLLPAHKWHSVSHDGGSTWSTPRPWGYSDGSSFYSPSSCSQLLPHTNGKLYWLGNISPTNPCGNLPRYPLVIAEVLQASFLIDRNSIFVIDSRQAEESEKMTLSNFYAREDRVTGEIVVHCSRFKAHNSWSGDAHLYRVALD